MAQTTEEHPQLSQQCCRVRSGSYRKWTIEKPVSIEKRFGLLGSLKQTLTSIGIVNFGSTPASGFFWHLYTEITFPSKANQRSSFHF